VKAVKLTAKAAKDTKNFQRRWDRAGAFSEAALQNHVWALAEIVALLD
jgi:hypothetical protein